MSPIGHARESSVEGAPTLEYLEGLEDGVVLVQEDFLERLREHKVSEDLLEQVRLEFVFRVQQVNKKKTLHLELCLGDGIQRG